MVNGIENTATLSIGISPEGMFIRMYIKDVAVQFPVSHPPRSLNFTKITHQKHNVKYTSLIFGQETSE